MASMVSHAVSLRSASSPSHTMEFAATKPAGQCCWKASSFGRDSSLCVLSSEVRLGRVPVRKIRLIRSHTETAEVAVNRADCPAVKQEISTAAFESVDIRVGLITHAKAVQDPEMSAKRGQPTLSRTHLQLTVDIGCEQRIVVSECKYVMDVEDAVGKKVLFVANVPPTEVHGIRSHGLLMTGFNYDPTPMPRSFKVTLPGLGRLPPGSELKAASRP